MPPTRLPGSTKHTLYNSQTVAATINPYLITHFLVSPVLYYVANSHNILWCGSLLLRALILKFL